MLTFSSSSLTIYCSYSKPPSPYSPSISVLHALCVSFSVWNQRSNRWHHLWFMAHSERTLIRCRQGSACAWMTMEDQSHYALQPHPVHSGHWRLHLAPWFMDAILAPERETKGDMEARGAGCGFSDQCQHLANIILVELCFVCVCEGVKANVCMWTNMCGWICVVYHFVKRFYEEVYWH